MIMNEGSLTIIICLKWFENFDSNIIVKYDHNKSDELINGSSFVRYQTKIKANI